MKRTLLITMLVLVLIDLTGFQNLSGLPPIHAQTGGGPSALLPSTPLGTSGASYELTWYTIDAGGGTSAASPYILVGTIGQPDTGAAMTGGGFMLVGGFWISAACQYKVYLPVVIR